MKTILFCSFLLIAVHSNASVIPVKRPADTTLNAVKHWSEEDFMQKFGTSDSARAIIGYYFDTRKRSKNRMIWSGTGTALSIAATAIVSSNINTGYGEPAALRGVLLAVVAGSVILSFMFIFGTVLLVRLAHSKKALYYDLLRFHSGKGIHKPYIRSKKFRMILQAEKANRAGNS